MDKKLVTPSRQTEKGSPLPPISVENPLNNSEHVEIKKAPHIKHTHKSAFGYILLTLFAVALGTGIYLYHLNKISPKPIIGLQSQMKKSVAPYAGWNTYNSVSEKASFRYPKSWKVTKPYEVSNDGNNTDQVGITSPSGKITISYVTDLTGFGNEHTSLYPNNTVITKTPIKNAPGLYVVSGITTTDGKTYSPWIAVQDDNGIVNSGVMGNVATFTSHYAINPSTDDFTGILFSTSGARTNQNSPSLTKSQATAWLETTEARQAKQILLSFNDATNPAANWLLYVSPGQKYSVRIPDGWQLNQQCPEPFDPLSTYGLNYNPQDSDVLKIQPGIKAAVTTNCFGKDGNPLLSFMWYDLNNQLYGGQILLNSISTNKAMQNEGTFQTDYGQTVDKYFMQATTPAQTIEQPEEGIYYEYIIKYNNSFVWVVNYYPPGATDYHTNVEEAIKTLILN